MSFLTVREQAVSVRGMSRFFRESDVHAEILERTDYSLAAGCE